MHIENSSILLIYKAVAVVAALVLVEYLMLKNSQRRRKNKWRRSLMAKLKLEEDRIDKLPKLDTRWLLGVPYSEKRINGEAAKRECARTFGSRHNRLYVIDEQGNEWVGLGMPETFKGLRGGEYIRCEYFIPFRGVGEAIAGKPVIIDDYCVHAYPMWMRERVTPENAEEWNRWVGLEKAHRDVFLYEDCQSTFCLFLPAQLLRELRTKRAEYDRLYDSVAAFNRKK